MFFGLEALGTFLEIWSLFSLEMESKLRFSTYYFIVRKKITVIKTPWASRPTLHRSPSQAFILSILLPQPRSHRNWRQVLKLNWNLARGMLNRGNTRYKEIMEIIVKEARKTSEVNPWVWQSHTWEHNSTYPLGCVEQSPCSGRAEAEEESWRRRRVNSEREPSTAKSYRPFLLWLK